MKYVKIRLSNKSDKKLILNDLLKVKLVSNDIIEAIQNIGKGNLSIVKNVTYDVGEFLKTTVLGATIETMEQFDNDIHVTYVKNNDYHTVVVPKSLVDKNVNDDVRVSYKELTYHDFDLKKSLYTSKDLKDLKENEILLKM